MLFVPNIFYHLHHINNCNLILIKSEIKLLTKTEVYYCFCSKEDDYCQSMALNIIACSNPRSAKNFEIANFVCYN